ncbi:MAG: glutaredoxin domain-containing protein [Arsenophonus sp.]|nr:MAG: glutaredoxin domain-containing protein [Arsenophonus sp.]
MNNLSKNHKKIYIFGRSKCSYCVSAINLAKKICKDNVIYQHEYIDINNKEHSNFFLIKNLKKKIKTVPQIFIENKYIGGYEEFKRYVEKNIF